MAFRPSSDSRLENSLRENSFDLSRSCLPARACWPIEGLRGRFFLSRRCIGGNDVYLPVGDGNTEGRSSLVVG